MTATPNVVTRTGMAYRRRGRIGLAHLSAPKRDALGREGFRALCQGSSGSRAVVVDEPVDCPRCARMQGLTRDEK